MSGHRRDRQRLPRSKRCYVEWWSRALHRANRRRPHRGVRGGSAPAVSMTDAEASVLREQGTPKSVDLTCHNTNHFVLVEGPEIAIRPVARRQVIPEGVGPVKGSVDLSFGLFAGVFGRAGVRRRGQGSGVARPRSGRRALMPAPCGARYRRRRSGFRAPGCVPGLGRGARQCRVSRRVGMPVRGCRSSLRRRRGAA